MRKTQGFFRNWQGVLGPLRLGKLAWLNHKLGNLLKCTIIFVIVHNHGIFGQLKNILAFTYTILPLN